MKACMFFKVASECIRILNNQSCLSTCWCSLTGANVIQTLLFDYLVIEKKSKQNQEKNENICFFSQNELTLTFYRYHLMELCYIFVNFLTKKLDSLKIKDYFCFVLKEKTSHKENLFKKIIEVDG